MKLTVLGSGYVVPSADEKLELALLERTLRRGLSELTKLFMHAAKLALDAAELGAKDVHVIFGSAFGEIALAEALLAEAYERDASSPARFRNSVHNTAPALFSISQHNELPSSAISAGWETVPMGLLEAAAQLESGAERVLLVFAEERVPSAISDQETHGSLAAAFVLAREGRGARLENLRRADTTLDAHPIAGALELARAIEQARSGPVALSASYAIDIERAR
jgi:hypothetical protein